MDPSKSVPETTVDAQLLELMLRVGSRWVLWLLLALSLAAVAVMIERVWFFIQERRPSDALDKALTALRKDGPAAAVVHLRGCRSMEAAVTLAVESERLRYERGLAFLGTLGSNAPFIGLFGTVLGIIRAFHDLAANTAQGAQAVMAGIAEALVATAVGLLVALPAVAMYNTLARHVETAASAAGAMGHAILAVVKAVPRDKKPREVA
jgi:biopolymer transport protein ExbB/TolQ